MAKTDWDEDLLLILELGQFFTVKDKTRKMVFEADGKIPAKTYILHKAAQINDFDFNEIYERELEKLELENPENIKYGIDTIIEEIQYKINRHILLTPKVKDRSHNLILKAKAFIQFVIDKDKKPEVINTDELIKNPFIKIFRNDIGFTIFTKMFELYKGDKNILANFSFLFYALEKEFLVCGQTEFIHLLEGEQYDIFIDKIDSRQARNDKKLMLYNSIREKHQK